MEFARDLASADVWADSLERSLARRGRPRRASLELGRLTAERDLADPETMNDSAVYWRTRRAASASSAFPVPAVGGASVLALIAASTLPSLAGGNSSAPRRGALHRAGHGAGGVAGVGQAIVHQASATPRTFVFPASPAKTSRGAHARATYTLLAAATTTTTHVLSATAPDASAAAASADTQLLSATTPAAAVAPAAAAPVLAAAAPDASAAAVATPTAVATPPKPVVYGKIARGDLRDAQRLLGLPVDNILGPKTGAAIRAFQTAHGLSADGVVGDATWGALKSAEHAAMHAASARAAAAAATPTIKASTFQAASSSPSSTDVVALQGKLGIAGDGTFGSATLAAVKEFQSVHGLSDDGVVGPSTRSALGLGDGPTLVAPGQSSGGATNAPDTTAAASSTASTDATASATTATTAATTATTTDASSSTTTATTPTGPSPSVSASLAAMITAGNQIATLPYIWGGGHGSFVAPGYDCSGSVSYVLHAAGLLSVPEDSGSLESYGAPGPGQYVTIYADAGHAWMTIEGRRFDTIALSQTGSRWSDTTGDATGMVVRHPVGF